MNAVTTIAAPAASAASNQNGSGKRTISREPSEKRYVPGGKKMAWNARKAGSKATAKMAARMTARRADEPRGGEHDPTLAPSLAAEPGAGDHGQRRGRPP